MKSRVSNLSLLLGWLPVVVAAQRPERFAAAWARGDSLVEDVFPVFRR